MGKLNWLYLLKIIQTLVKKMDKTDKNVYEKQTNEIKIYIKSKKKIVRKKLNQSRDFWIR